MYKVSDYVIDLKLDNCDNKNLLVHGYKGSFDIVNDEVFTLLNQCRKDNKYIDNIENELKENLIKRGYITTLNSEEEFIQIQKLSKALHEYSQKTVSITIMPTYNCNFRCEYCFEQNLLTKGPNWLNCKISTEVVDAIFRQVDKYREEGRNVDSVYLFGGEPLLRVNKDIVLYILEKCKAANVSINVISNGYDLDAYDDLLVEYDVKSVQITIDGVGDDHDKRRFLAGGQGTYKRICENVTNALEKGVNIVIRSNINKKNLDVIDRVIKSYKEYDWTSYDNFRYYFKSTLRCYENVGDALSDVELMKSLAEAYGEDISKFSINSIYNGLGTKIKYMIENKSFAPFRTGYCGANLGLYTVDPYGDLYPCWDVLGEPKNKVGKVDIDKGEFILNDVDSKWRGRRVDTLDDCKKCKYLLFCGGGCSAQAKVINKDLNKVFCDDFTTIFDEVATEICSLL